MTEPTPITVGRIVTYKLSASDAKDINRRRSHASTYAKEHQESATGVIVHRGNQVGEGDEFPLIVTRVWTPGMVNGQVFLDGNDLYWATSVTEGDEPRHWHWPVRV